MRVGSSTIKYGRKNMPTQFLIQFLVAMLSLRIAWLRSLDGIFIVSDGMSTLLVGGTDQA